MPTSSNKIRIVEKRKKERIMGFTDSSQHETYNYPSSPKYTKVSLYLGINTG